MCEPTAEHSRFLRALFAGNPDDGFRPGQVLAPEPLRHTFAPIHVDRLSNYWVVGTAVSGRWHGLPLTAVELSLPQGGDAGDVSYSFAAPVRTVERVLQSLGFPARAGENVQMGPPDGYDYLMTLVADDIGGSVWSCGYR